MKEIDRKHIGTLYGRITILEVWRVPRETKAGIDLHRTTLLGRGVCACGTLWEGRLGALTSGSTRSCGCLKQELTIARMTTHGLKGSKSYSAWVNMNSRCYNPLNKHYKDYGERGISVCDEWRDNPTAFVRDMGEPTTGESLERRDNEGNYCKENCRWASSFDQMRNRRSNRWVEYKGERKILTDWAAMLGITPSTLDNRLRRFDIETAMTMKFRSRNR